jgi:hypothetical protein
MRITGRNGLIYLGLPERETVLGLKLPPEMIPVDVSEMNIDFSAIEGLKDASVTFTGYYDKDDNGEDPAGTSGT